MRPRPRSTVRRRRRSSSLQQLQRARIGGLGLDVGVPAARGLGQVDVEGGGLVAQAGGGGVQGQAGQALALGGSRLALVVAERGAVDAHPVRLGQRALHRGAQQLVAEAQALLAVAHQQAQVHQPARGVAWIQREVRGAPVLLQRVHHALGLGGGEVRAEQRAQPRVRRQLHGQGAQLAVRQPVHQPQLRHPVQLVRGQVPAAAVGALAHQALALEAAHQLHQEEGDALGALGEVLERGGGDVLRGAQAGCGTAPPRWAGTGGRAAARGGGRRAYPRRGAGARSRGAPARTPTGGGGTRRARRTPARPGPSPRRSGRRRAAGTGAGGGRARPAIHRRRAWPASAARQGPRPSSAARRRRVTASPGWRPRRATARWRAGAPAARSRWRGPRASEPVSPCRRGSRTARRAAACAGCPRGRPAPARGRASVTTRALGRPTWSCWASAALRCVLPWPRSPSTVTSVGAPLHQRQARALHQLGQLAAAAHQHAAAVLEDGDVLAPQARRRAPEDAVAARHRLAGQVRQGLGRRGGEQQGGGVVVGGVAVLAREDGAEVARRAPGAALHRHRGHVHQRGGREVLRGQALGGLPGALHGVLPRVRIEDAGEAGALVGGHLPAEAGERLLHGDGVGARAEEEHRHRAPHGRRRRGRGLLVRARVRHRGGGIVGGAGEGLLERVPQGGHGVIAARALLGEAAQHHLLERARARAPAPRGAGAGATGGRG